MSNAFPGAPPNPVYIYETSLKDVRDVLGTAPPALRTELKATALYNVCRATLKHILGKEPPDAMFEADLKVQLLNNLGKFVDDRVDRGYYRTHLGNCGANLRAGVSDTKAREAIGEVLAAIATARRCEGWRMIQGYGARGHRGVDQFWVKSDEQEYLIVESKGGQGTLSEKPVHDHGINHQGGIGFQCHAAQMSKAWVFIGCNGLLLKDQFTNAVLNKQPFNGAVIGNVRHYLRICLSLWEPGPTTKLGLYTGSPFRPVAPTGCLNRALGWSEAQAILLPKVSGVVCTNGLFGELMGYAGPRTVFAAATVDSRGAGGRPVADDTGMQVETKTPPGTPRLRPLGPVAEYEQRLREKEKKG